MVAVSIRGLDEAVKEKLRIRAARHGRSMEAEMRAILTAAVMEEDRLALSWVFGDPNHRSA
jgi:plasmid stability protein